MKIAPKQYHKNPRQITTKQMTRLALTLEKLGDLSGIVHELNTNELIGGNQRGKIFRLDECEIVLTDAFDEPDNQGTVGLGYAIWHGKKYAYRQVRWDAKTAEEANVTANKGGGTFDFDILADNFELDDLLEWGFEPFELGLVDENDIDAEWEGMPEFEQDDLSAQYNLKINFATLEDKQAFGKLIGQPLTEKTRSVWYPAQSKENLLNLGIVDEP